MVCYVKYATYGKVYYGKVRYDMANVHSLVTEYKKIRAALWKAWTAWTVVLRWVAYKQYVSSDGVGVRTRVGNIDGGVDVETEMEMEIGIGVAFFASFLRMDGGA